MPARVKWPFIVSSGFSRMALSNASRPVNSQSSFLTMNCSCNEALRFSSQSLRRSGFRPMQTFDLQVARLGLEGCLCPHHGTSECDCQMVVLFIYGAGTEPAVLILHGNDGQTWLSLVDTPGQKADSGMAAAIKAALMVQTSPGE